MFRIVDDSECRRYRQDCAKVLTQVRDTLRDEKDIISVLCYVHNQCTDYNKIPYKRCARDKPDDRTPTSRRERWQCLYDRFIPAP